MTSATIVTETCNLSAGQSFDQLTNALRAAGVAAAGTAGGPHSVLLMDSSSDTRTTELVRRIAAETGAVIRHARLPVGSSYDICKDLASELADTDAVAYLDGDCIPEQPPSMWLTAMLDCLDSTGAPGVSGTTLYERDTAVRFASSVLDFGFLVDRPGGELGCYASNNVAFRRSIRATSPAERDGIRCACYAHAQRFARQGTPLQHVPSADAVVRHEFPPLLDERLRRGYDAVAIMWIDRDLMEAHIFGGNRLTAATLGVARFMRHQLSSDRRRWEVLRRYSQIGDRQARVALALIPLLRVLDVLGMWRALFLPRDPRWATTVTLEQARATAIASLSDHHR